MTSAPAFRFDHPAVKIDEMLRDRKTQPKPAELTANGRIGLLEWLKERSQPVAFDSNSIIGDRELKTAATVVACPDGDLSAG